MSCQPSPRLILETLLPHLRVAAGYARTLQPKIKALPEKANSKNHFGAALTDADLSIQTLVEVALLGNFPHIHFFGEEYEKSYNTKYFPSIELPEQEGYLVTLDPIDGTRYYLDGHSNYQIILSVLNWDDYEAVLAISPSENCYFWALRGQGAFYGELNLPLEGCQPLKLDKTANTIFLGFALTPLKAKLEEKYKVLAVATDYSETQQIPNVNGLFSGDLCGAIIESGNFIDGAALAFIAREAGCIVTTHSGEALPPLKQCENKRLPGLIIASSTQVHQDLMNALS